MEEMTLETQARFFEMGCDAAEECFRPLDPESPGRRGEVYRRYDSIQGLIIHMRTELQKLPEKLRLRAAEDIMFGILGRGLDLLYGSRSQRAQREANAAASLPHD
jgi:hypothetical protein